MYWFGCFGPWALGAVARGKGQHRQGGCCPYTIYLSVQTPNRKFGPVTLRTSELSPKVRSDDVGPTCCPAPRRATSRQILPCQTYTVNFVHRHWCWTVEQISYELCCSGSAAVAESGSSDVSLMDVSLTIRLRVATTLLRKFHVRQKNAIPFPR